jgi:hypothetical protein
MKKNNNSKHGPVLQDDDGEIKKTLKETLTRSIQMLKIAHHNQISERVFQFVEKATSQQIKT